MQIAGDVQKGSAWVVSLTKLYHGASFFPHGYGK